MVVQNNGKNKDEFEEGEPGGSVTKIGVPDIQILPRHSRGRRAKLRDLIEDYPKIYERVMMMIRLGAFDHIAAQTIGILPITFRTWMSKGRKQRKGIYASFYEDVTLAKGHARMMAESQVRSQQPLPWLRLGPGKPDPEDGSPGWGEDSLTLVHEGGQHPIQTEALRALQVDDATMLKSLEVFEELGYIKITDRGRTLFAGNTQAQIEGPNTINVESGDVEGNGQPG